MQAPVVARRCSVSATASTALRSCPECGLQTEALVCPNDGEMTMVVVKKEDPNAGRVGMIIHGRYRVEKVIGQGGFGAVYRAAHTATGDTVAIKVLRTDVQGAEEVIQRFRQEAKTTSKLKHPNTVRVFDFGQMDDGNLFLAMEFLEGKTLTDLIRKEGPLAPRRLVHIIGQVLKALSEAHAKGLVHRDLKPDNIFLQHVHGEPDFVKVLDFGIAKSLGGDMTAGANMTSTGAIIGTPKYMSPEQARGSGIDARTDIYAAGLILYEGLTGDTPFTGDSPLTMLLRRVQEEAPPIPAELQLPTPQGVCEAVQKALSRNANERFSSADEMLAALIAGLDTPILPARTTVGGGARVVANDTGEFDATLAPAETEVLSRQLAAAAPAAQTMSGATVVSSPPPAPPKPAAATVVPVAEPASDESAPKKRGVPTGAVIGAAVVILIALGVVFGMSGGDKPAAASPEAPAAAASPPAAAGAPAAPGPTGLPPSAAAEGTLELKVYPADAAVTVDGRGVAAAEVRLLPGLHTVVASKPGFARAERTVEIAPGKSVVLDLQLQADAAPPAPVAAPAPTPAPAPAPAPAPGPSPGPSRPRPTPKSGGGDKPADAPKPAAPKPSAPKPPPTGGPEI